MIRFRIKANGNHATDIQAIRMKLIDKGLVIFGFLMPMALVLSLLRIPEFGWNNIYIMHIFVVSLSILSAILRNFLPYRIKAAVFLGILLVLGIGGVITFGLAGGGGIMLLIVFTILTAIAFGTKGGLFASFIDLIIIIIAAIFITTGRITHHFDIEAYVTSIQAWLVIGIVFFMFIPVIVIMLGVIHNSLISSIKEIRESTAKNRRLVNNLVDSFLYRHDANGVFTYFSSSVTKVLGYSIDEMSTHYAQYFTDNPINDKATAHTMQSLSGIQQPPYEIQLLNKDKKIQWLEVSETPVRDENGNVVAVEGVAHDITARKESAEKITKLQNYLSNIIDSMPSMLIGLDPDGRVTQWNRQSEKKTGIPHKNAIGRDLAHLIPRLKIHNEIVAEAMRAKEVKALSRQHIDEKKKTIYEEITIYPLESTDNHGVVLLIDDITEKVQLNEVLIQSEKMLSIGGLAAGMAHEINNPLAGMLQTSNVMSRRLIHNIDNQTNLKAAEEIGVSIDSISDFLAKRDIPRMISTIIESGQRISRIINNMLSFSRKSESLFSENEITDILENSILLASADFDLSNKHDFKKIKIFREYDENCPRIFCEASKLQQVFMNILRNGSQAMNESDTQNPHFILRVYVNPSRNSVSIEFEDNGPGMDEDIRKRIFEPFFTTKRKGIGTGLGLSVSYFIITDNHKGEMTVESSPGNGTKFIIKLPLSGQG